MDPKKITSPAAITGLCTSCKQFFHNEAEQRRKGRLILLKNTSPADWAPYALRIHDDLSSLFNAAADGCSLCFPIWRASLLAENQDLDQSRFIVYLSTNPGGRSPTMPGQVCSLFGSFVPEKDVLLVDTNPDVRMFNLFRYLVLQLYRY
jgi:hypothetical protein